MKPGGVATKKWPVWLLLGKQVHGVRSAIHTASAATGDQQHG